MKPRKRTNKQSPARGKLKRLGSRPKPKRTSTKRVRKQTAARHPNKPQRKKVAATNPMPQASSAPEQKESTTRTAQDLENGRGAMLKRLGGIQGSLLWFDESPGYGASASIYVLCAEGLYAGGTEVTSHIEGPLELSAEEHAEAVKRIAAGAEDEGDEIIDMVKAGCKPGIEYYRWSNEWREIMGDDAFYQNRSDLDARFAEHITTYAMAEPWEEMDDEALRYWNDVLTELEQGRRSVYD
mgnify:CR=1 FL=1